MRLDERAAGLADPDCDINALGNTETEKELIAAREPELIPRLEAHLAEAVDAGN